MGFVDPVGLVRGWAWAWTPVPRIKKPRSCALNLNLHAGEGAQVPVGRLSHVEKALPADALFQREVIALLRRVCNGTRIRHRDDMRLTAQQ